MPADTANSTPPRATLLAAATLGAAGLWAFWPTLIELVRCWQTQPDYSHGFLVPLVAAVVLYLRRASFPGFAAAWSWWGALLLVLSLVLRACGALWYIESCDQWALALWIAGLVTLFCGPRVAWWSAPALIFLLLAMPLPFRLENFCSQPLQRIATLGSVWTLQALGLPAFAEGNIILLGEHRLEVERACAGLRIFLGITALALVWAAVSQRSVYERLLLLAAALPVAVIANIGRIVITAACFHFAPNDIAQWIAHEAAGWIMIPLALVLLGIAHWYLSRAIAETGALRVADAVGRNRA